MRRRPGPQRSAKEADAGTDPRGRGDPGKPKDQRRASQRRATEEAEAGANPRGEEERVGPKEAEIKGPRPRSGGRTDPGAEPRDGGDRAGPEELFGAGLACQAQVEEPEDEALSRRTSHAA